MDFFIYFFQLYICFTMDFSCINSVFCENDTRKREQAQGVRLR